MTQISTERISDPLEGLKTAMRHFASGVTVITAGTGEARRGTTATAFTSVTMEPPTVLVCLNRASSANPAVRGAGRFCVNILAEGQDEACATFSGQSGLSGADRFGPFDWSPCAGEDLALKGALAAIGCTVSGMIEEGTHTIFLGRVEEVLLTPSARPLVHYDRALRPIGG
ncbi:flavin reductase family protein [Paenirhodobacter populi]|uniref:Flavin reductase n=1 Tax=Paenirhodobacter populi TaxID=2306993 RepID=A0A443J1J6_9RHOB|nr:flavin reductase family protein [Sinirhodobacter populi]RWR14408.1 flavin reductase [Sinirhodobacter populi]